MTTSITDTAPAADQREPSDRPRWPELQPGEQVSVSFEAEVGYGLDSGGPVATAQALFKIDGPVYVYLPQDHPQVTITRAAPADGVPQPGELWADRTGTVYLVLEPWSDEEPVMPMLSGGGRAVVRWRFIHTGEDGPIRRLMTAEQIASYR